MVTGVKTLLTLGLVKVWSRGGLHAEDKDQYGCVKVTQKNFDHIITQTQKSVLMVFYTPEVQYLSFEHHSSLGKL